MSKQTFAAIENLAATATRTVKAYNAAGRTFATAYRKGVEQMLTRTPAVRAAQREEQMSMLSDQAREQLTQARQKWNDLILQRVEADTNNMILVMDRIAVAATSGIDAAVQQLMLIDSPAAHSFIDGVIALQMPAAELSAQVADQVLAGAQRIEARVEGEASDVEARDVVVRPARRARKAA